MHNFKKILYPCFILPFPYIHTVPTGPPSAITITSTTANSVTMNITEPSPEDRNGYILYYTIDLTRLSTRRLTRYTSGVVGQLFTAFSLTPFTMYSYVVAANTINGTGPYSLSSSFTTSEAGVYV